MPLEKFPLLQDNTRLIKFKDTLYKVKVKYKLNTFSDGDVTFNQAEAHKEIEQTFRAVLYLNERDQALKTIATPNFLIQPNKLPWSFPRKCSDYSFQQNGKSLKVFDHMFELHISNRESEQYSSENALDLDADRSLTDGNRSSIKGKGEKLKEAVVIVTDINSEATNRFGRTKDGKFYRVLAQRTAPIQGNSSTKKGHDQHKRGHGSPEKASDSFRQPLEIDGKIKEREVDKNAHKSNKRHSETSDLQDPTHREKRQSGKQAIRKERDEISQLPGRPTIETVKQKLDTPRDKFSLRISELRELKRVNVQPQRLRSRKSKHLDQKIQKDYKVKVNYVEQSTESESSQNEDVNEAVNQRDKMNSANHRHERLKTRSKNRHTNSSNQKIKEQTDTNFRTRHKLKEGTPIRRLKEGRRRRRNRPRSYRAAHDTSSHLELETDESIESDTGDTGEKQKDVEEIPDSSHKSESTLSVSDTESGRSRRKSRRLEKKRELELSAAESEEESQSAGTSQDSATSRKVKLYASRHSPQVIIALGSKPVIEVSSPRVSTVLPVKRDHTGSATSSRGQRSEPRVASPRVTRQSLHDDELRRIQGLREERPTQIYRDIVLAQGRDRYMVEQAENAETDKLRQLYQPTVGNQSGSSGNQRASKRRKSSGIWGRIMDTLVTPSKKYMFGKKS